MAVQTTYNQNISPAVVGQRANMELFNAISRIVEDAAGIGFGLLVVQGTGPQGIKAATALAEAAGSATALGTNTGNGTIGTITASAGALPGGYTVEFDDATHFVVSAPNGAEIGHGVAGAAFSAGNVGFTFTAGGTPMAAGDSFQFSVTQSGGGILRGITLRDQTLLPPGDPLGTVSGDVYPQNATAAVMTRGVVWVTAGATVAAGDPVYFVPSTGRFTNVPGTTNVPLPDSIFDSAGVAAGFVQVRVKV